MGRPVKETQKTVLEWADVTLTPQSSDEVMHEFLDVIKEFEVSWFSSDSYTEIAEGLGDAAVMLCRLAGEMSTDVTEELNSSMARKRKGA